MLRSLSPLVGDSDQITSHVTKFEQLSDVTSQLAIRFGPKDRGCTPGTYRTDPFC